MMRYWPVPSVTTERTFSINAGLEASTVTPGSTAPDASRTVPVNVPWANAEAGSRITASHRKHFAALHMSGVLLRFPRVGHGDFTSLPGHARWRPPRGVRLVASARNKRASPIWGRPTAAAIYASGGRKSTEMADDPDKKGKRREERCGAARRPDRGRGRHAGAEVPALRCSAQPSST